MPPVLGADDNFDTHEWKSEFASNRSGRNSPNIFAKVRRKLLLTPPVRNARSPRLTDEELDALTGDLPYATNYTYAYSKIYDPSLPDHWEVPNLAGGAAGTLAEQEHYSAASLSRQLLYILRFPVYLILHVITYILEAFYHLIKLSTFTLWDYIMYLIQLVKIRYALYKDNRRRTALIRNRQDPFSVKAGRFIRRFFEIIFYIVATPYRMFSKSAGVEQYDYTSIKDQLENERNSRMVTRSQALERSRRFDGLSQSPSRHTTPAVSKTSTVTRITTKVFTNSRLNDDETPDDPTPTVVTTRTIRERSVTPRFRNSRSKADNQGAVFDSPEEDIDASMSSYGLRSRRVSHLNTPEATFDIGRAAATSTPLEPRTLNRSLYIAKQESSKFQTIITWLGYIILFPFFAARHIWYTIYDYGKSAYMKWTDYQQAPMEEIHIRDVGEPVPYDAYTSGVLYMPWTSRVSLFFKSFWQSIKESHRIVFAMLYGVAQDAAYYAVALYRGLTYRRKSDKFTWCHVLIWFLVLFMALFVATFYNSDNTAIRQELEKETIAHNTEKNMENGLPAVPLYIRAGNHIKHYGWMVKEYVYDLVFNSYNFIAPIVGRTVTAPRYAWNLIVSGCGAVADTFGSIFTAVETFSTNLWYFITGGFSHAGKSAGGLVYEGYEGLRNGTNVVAGTIKTYVYDAFSGISKLFSAIFGGLLNFSSASQSYFFSFFKNVAYGTSDFFYNYIYAPIAGFFNYITGNYQQLLQPLWSLFRWIYDFTVFGVKTIIEWACFLVTYPFALATRAWIKISQYAPEDVVQVIPIPQAITPTPIVEPIVEEPEDSIETLRKRHEIGEEELVIIPAPAPEPIPVPVPNSEPVVIHQTHIVETVDKDAIIREVTEKLRAELTAQFQQDLTAKFEQNYNEVIQMLKLENTNIQYDNNHLEAIIRQMIYEYDTDKTGKVDYALESSGGAVISTRCSETYKSYTRLEKFWDIPIYYHHYSPRVVIQRNSKSLFPGECWCFKDGRGYIAVELSHFIDVSSISYEHIGKEVAPEGNRSSAPKGILVWAYKQIDDLNSRVLLGDYTYDLDGPPLQFFIAKHKPDFPVKFVELEVTSNYGAQFTCLYRLRVHGKMLKV